MADALIIGYGVRFDEDGRVLLLHRRRDWAPWADRWWLPGDATPLTEEPDATVPRVFAQLLRQQVDAGFVGTVFGEEPTTGRHTVHNGYLVTVRMALDPQPDDETNPFDAAQWFTREEALAELPSEQAALLRSAIELDEAGLAPAPSADLDALFDSVGTEPERAESACETAAGAPDAPDAVGAPRMAGGTERAMTTDGTTQGTTHAERREAGVQTLHEMTGTLARAFPFMEKRNGAFGTFVLDYVFGQIWQGEELNRRDRNLVSLAMLGALERIDAVRFHASFTKRNGLEREEVAEVALQIAAYAGFPAGNLMIDALHQMWTKADLEEYVIPPAAHKDDEQRHRDAVDVLRTLNGLEEAQDPAEVLAGMERIGVVGKLAFEFAFGDLWSREQLSRRDRSLVVVSILVALNKVEELRFHIPGALNHGVTPTELEGVMATAAYCCGFPRAVEGMRALQRALREREASGA